MQTTMDKERKTELAKEYLAIPDIKPVRADNAVQKRVELHCHTNMSDLDGVNEAGELIGRAASWGHKALAITDHGVVQAFIPAFHALNAARKLNPEFKVIYGLEAYVVDDLTGAVINDKGQTLDDTFVVDDLETTGLSANKGEIIEIGAVKVSKGKIIGRFSSFVKPCKPIPEMIAKLTSITDQMFSDAPEIAEILPKFLNFCDGAVLVGHNVGFELSFIKHNVAKLGMEQDFTAVDTLAMARVLLPDISKYKLDIVANALNITCDQNHRAVDDAELTTHIFLRFIEMFKKKGLHNLNDLKDICTGAENVIKKSKTHHAPCR